MNNISNGINFSAPPYLTLIKPDMLDRIQGISPESKPRVHSAISQAWALIHSQPQASPQHQNAISTLQKFGAQIRNMVQQHQQRALQAGNQSGPSAAQATAQASATAQARLQAQQGQNPQQTQQTQANAQAQAQARMQAQQANAQAQAQQAPNQQTQQGQQASTQQQGQGQQARPQQPNQQAAQRPGGENAGSAVSQNIRTHVANFPFTHPPSHPEGTPEGIKWLEATRSQYTSLLVYLEKAQTLVRQRQEQEDRLKASGQPVPQQLVAEKEAARVQWNKFKKQLDSFRQNQAILKEKKEAAMPTDAKKEQTATTAAPNNGNIPTKPFTLQQPPPGVQTATNPTIDTARANNAAGSAANAAPQAQTPTQGQPSASQGTFAQPGRVIQNGNPVRPTLNTTQPGQPNTIQGPTSAIGTQQPTPLSHGAALDAARSHSDQRPPTAAQPNALNPSTSHQTNITQQQHKFPISKTLPQSVMNPPQPVMTGPNRPTMANGGASSQPIIAKQPTFTLEGDGNSRVLSKKKLDELVRQVTGGAETVTPEVEEVSYPYYDHERDSLTFFRSSWKLPMNLLTASSQRPADWRSSETTLPWKFETSKQCLSVTTIFAFQGTPWTRPVLYVA